MANSGQFQPGHKLAKGRPNKNTTWSEIMRGVLNVDARRAIVLALAEAAKKGDSKAAQVLMDRMDGKPQQSIEMSGDQEKPLLIGRGVAKGKDGDSS